MDEIYKPNHNAPPHLFRPRAIYMLTASTYHRKPILDSRARAIICKTLFEQSILLGWSLRAWAVLANHYHWVAESPEDAITLSALLRRVHSITAREINRNARISGRRVWQNYWDTCISHETSYLARLHYVHVNPVKHGLVRDARDYPFCSYRWFLEIEDTAWKQKVLAQQINHINVHDDF